MTPFFKYLLVSLLLFAVITALCFRIFKPISNARHAAVSDKEAEQFVVNAQELDTLYRTFRQALKASDPSMIAQSKGSFQGKIIGLSQQPPTGTDMDTLFRKVIRSYKALIKVNEEMVQNQKKSVADKQKIKDAIEQLTQTNQLTRQQIMFISSQPPPVAAPKP